MTLRISGEMVAEFQDAAGGEGYDWIKNTKPTAAVATYEAWTKNGFKYAEPKAGEGETVEGLKANGFVGVYKKELAPANI